MYGFSSQTEKWGSVKSADGNVGLFSVGLFSA